MQKQKSKTDTDFLVRNINHNSVIEYCLYFINHSDEYQNLFFFFISGNKVKKNKCH